MAMVIGGVVLKIKSLNFKLIIYFSIILILISSLLAYLFINAFNDYYYEDVFKTLEQSSSLYDEDISTFIKNKDDSRKIQDLTWLKTNDEFKRKFNKIDSFFTEEIIKKIEINVLKQKEDIKRYNIYIKDKELLYIIKKLPYYNASDKKFIKNTTQIYYRAVFKWKPSDNLLEKNLLKEIILILFLGIILLLISTIFLSSYLIKPLKILEANVSEISNRNLKKEISLNRDDEIGRLGKSIDDMRKELLKFDENQKFKLHSISHELKTPIMIIKSYTQAIKDGMYKDLNKNLNIIMDESNRLERLTYNLLYINQLDYLNKNDNNKDLFNLKDLIRNTISKYHLDNYDFDIICNLDDIEIRANYNQFKIIIENLLENQIRYANKKILINLKTKDEKILIQFFNDGKKLDENIKIFDLFKKGEDGQTGIGLYIVKKLLVLNNANIKASNHNDLVLFEIIINS